MTWESYLFASLGMTAGVVSTDYGKISGMYVSITRPDHPLAAGLVNVANTPGVKTSSVSGSQYWGYPLASADVIATIPAAPTQAAIFVYEAGDAMLDIAAPAKRVGVFFGEGVPSKWTVEGKRLFDAALRYATGL